MNQNTNDMLRASLRRNVIAEAAVIAVLLGGIRGWAATIELSGAEVAGELRDVRNKQIEPSVRRSKRGTS